MPSELSVYRAPSSPTSSWNTFTLYNVVRCFRCPRTQQAPLSKTRCTRFLAIVRLGWYFLDLMAHRCGWWTLTLGRYPGFCKSIYISSMQRFATWSPYPSASIRCCFFVDTRISFHLSAKRGLFDTEPYIHSCLTFWCIDRLLNSRFYCLRNFANPGAKARAWKSPWSQSCQSWVCESPKHPLTMSLLICTHRNPPFGCE